MIKYMKTFGFRINNDAFSEHSWHFRNALVQANYNDLQKDIHSTECTIEELAVLELVAKNPTMKQWELVEATGKSIATVKRIMKFLPNIAGVDKNGKRRNSCNLYKRKVVSMLAV